MSSKILLRRGTAAQWASANPILGSGELGVETDTLKFKIGNGTSTWTQLTSYANITPSDLTSAINGLINAAPSALDTLNELAAAINNDSSFSTTVNNLLNGKVSKSGGDIITAATASTTPLTIRGAASQTADILQIQDSGGAARAVFERGGALSVQPSTALNGYTGFFKSPSSSVAGLMVRGAASQTANLQEWQNSAGTMLSKIDPSGSFYAGNSYFTSSNTYVAGTLSSSKYILGGDLSLIPVAGGQSVISSWWGLQLSGLRQSNVDYTPSNVSAANVAHVIMPLTQSAAIGLLIRGAASQTANLQEWQSSDGTVIAKVDINGSITAGTNLIVGNAAMFYTGGNYYNSTISILTQGAGYSGIVVRGQASQTADLQQWQNSSGTVVARIGSGGPIVTSSVGVFGAQSNTPNAQLFVLGNSTSNPTFVIKSAASQTANLTEWQNNSGTILSKIDVSGNITAPSYNLSDSKYLLRKTIKKTVDPAGNAIANNTYDLFDMSFSSSLQGTFYIQASIRGGGYGQNLTYSLPVTYQMDWINNYAITNPFTNGVNWVDLTPLTFSPRHLMVSDYFKFQAKVNNNQISFRIKLTGTLTSTPLFDIYIQHSEEFANSTITELNTTGTDATTSNVMPNFLSSRAGLSAIFNPISLYSNSAYNIPLTVKGFASQSANLQEWQDSSGTILTKIMSNGSLFVNSTGTSNDPITIQRASTTRFKVDPYGNVFAIALTVGNVVNSISGTMAGIYTNSASSIGLVVKGSVSQTADLQQWWDSNSNVLSKIDSSGAIYLINPTANNNSNDTPSPAINFQGNIWNSAYGNQNIKGAIKVAAYAPNANPTISKMSFLLATDNGTPAEVASFTNTGAFSNIGGLDAYGSSVIFRLRNTTAPANSDTFTPSPKLELIGRGWNSNQGGSPSRAYLQVNVNNTNSDPFINRLGFFIATGNDAGGYAYGADATEYLSILGNGTVGINTTIPLGTLDIRPISASNKGIVIKAAASQTANLQEWQDSAGTVLNIITSDGTFKFKNSVWHKSIENQDRVYYEPYSSSYYKSANAHYFRNSTDTTLLTINNVGNVLVNGFSASTVGLIVKAAASQTANLQEWQDSAGIVKSNINSSGLNEWRDSTGTYRFGLKYSADRNIIDINSTNSGLVFGWSPNYIGGFGTDFGAGNTWWFSPYASDRVGVIIIGKSSQTADLQQWKDSSGTVLAKVDANGSGTFTGSASTNAISAYSGASGNYVFQGFNQSNNLTSIIYQSGEIYSASNIYVQGAANYNAAINVKPGNTSKTGLVIRGLASQAANLQEWQDSSGTLKAFVRADGYMYSYQGFGGTIDAGQWIGGAVLTAKPYIASQVAEIIRGVTSQTADLTQWQNSAGTVMVKIAADGSQTWYNPSNSSTIASISPYGEIFAQGNMYVRSASNYGASLNVTTPTTSYIGAVIRGISGQTADLQQWQNSGGTVLAKVDASGSINAVGLSLTSTVSGTMFSVDPTYGGITSRGGAVGFSGAASLNIGTNYTGQSAIVASGFAGQSVSTVIIKSVTSQTSNLQEWQDSAGTVKSSINASGSLELNGKDIELMNIMGAF